MSLSKPPKVACIMLVNGRREMCARAIRCFEAQAYQNASLLILNTGAEPLPVVSMLSSQGASVHQFHMPGAGRNPIGYLRNQANTLALSLWPDTEVFAHWDSDDWYGPDHLTRLVELWQHVDESIVGYSEVLFYETKRGNGEAWLYKSANPMLPIGASLLYSVRAWDRRRFPPNNIGEDLIWLTQSGLRYRAVPGFGTVRGVFAPSMIATIHESNTSSRVEPSAIDRHKAGRATMPNDRGKEWRRVPERDYVCKQCLGAKA